MAGAKIDLAQFYQNYLLKTAVVQNVATNFKVLNQYVMRIFKNFFTALFVAALVPLYAQVEVTTTTTTLPDWGVADARDARYYYLPDMESYYDVRAGNFVYLDNGTWVRTKEVPPAHANVDLWDTYKVVINDDKEPFADFDKMKVKYAKGYKGDPQKTVKIKKRKDGTIKIKEKSN